MNLRPSGDLRSTKFGWPRERAVGRQRPRFAPGSQEAESWLSLDDASDANEL